MGIRRPRRPPARPPQQATGPRPASLLREWHTLDRAERQDAWRDLVAWVAWLHDRYELSVEERLPLCWTQHPGLIEELHALRVWRLEIYQQDTHGSPADPGAEGSPSASSGGGQAARYWHAELRQVIQAAVSWYAAGCRSGHRASQILSARTSSEWAHADPLIGISAQLLESGARNVANGGAMTDGPTAEALWMSAEAMNALVLDGQARPLGEKITEWMEFDGSWWNPAPADQESGRPAGWRRITDPSLTTDLTDAATRMRAADQALGSSARTRSANQDQE